MLEFLTFSDLELEFLESLDITFKDNCFCNNKTGDTYKLIGATYGPVKEFERSFNYYKYDFKGRDGSITFVRSKDGSTGMPSIIVRLKDVILTISTRDATSIDFSEEDKEKVSDVISNIKSVCIEINTIRGKKRQSFISIKPYSGTDKDGELSETGIYIDKKEVAVIYGRLKELLYRIGFSDITKEINTENYSESFREVLHEVFKDTPVLIDYYLKVLHFFTRVFDATLYIPAINESMFRTSFEWRRHSHKDHFDMEMSNAKLTYDMGMSDVEKAEETFEDMIGKFPYPQQMQK